MRSNRFPRGRFAAPSPGREILGVFDAEEARVAEAPSIPKRIGPASKRRRPILILTYETRLRLMLLLFRSHGAGVRCVLQDRGEILAKRGRVGSGNRRRELVYVGERHAQ